MRHPRTPYLPDDWHTVPGLFAFEQLFISTDETVMWNILTYDRILELRDQLTNSETNTVTIYFGDSVYTRDTNTFQNDSYRLNLNSQLIEEFLVALADDHHLCIRVGKNLPQSTHTEYYDLDDGKAYIASYVDASFIAAYSEIIRQQDGGIVEISKVQLCPEGNHGILTHTANIAFSQNDLDAAQKVLDQDPTGIIVWDSILYPDQSQL